MKIFYYINSNFFKKNNLLSIFLCGIILCSCVETVVIGSVTGSALAIREKSISNTQKDILIATQLGSKFIKNGLKNIGNSVDITVNEGRVLLTGIVRDNKKAKLASELAWQINNVKEVIDEIQISEENLRPRDFSSALIDYLISLQIEVKIFAKSNLHSVNYKITTVNKIVYFLGIARDDSEMQNALDIASKINGVKKVINHLVLVNDVKRRK